MVPAFDAGIAILSGVAPVALAVVGEIRVIPVNMFYKATEFLRFSQGFLRLSQGSLYNSTIN